VNLSGVDLNLLVALDALLRERSVTRAAERVHLSQSAMSSALARVRDLFGDPILVRAGRRMALTPRAEALRGEVSEILSAAGEVLGPGDGFDPETSRRRFRIGGANVAAVALALVPRFIAQKPARAPNVEIEFPDLGDPIDAPLASGALDLAVVAQAELPEGLRQQLLIEEPIACLAAAPHPQAASPLTLEGFLALDHLRVASPARALDGVDYALARLGRERRVALTVPDFLHAPLAVATSGLVAAVPRSFARMMARFLPLQVLEPPLELPPYRVLQGWHPRGDRDPGCRWLRGFLLELVSTGRPGAA